MCCKKGLLSCVCCPEFLAERTHTCVALLSWRFVFSSMATMDNLPYPHQVSSPPALLAASLMQECLSVREIIHTAFPFAFPALL